MDPETESLIQNAEDILDSMKDMMAHLKREKEGLQQRIGLINIKIKQMQIGMKLQRRTIESLETRAEGLDLMRTHLDRTFTVLKAGTPHPATTKTEPAGLTRREYNIVTGEIKDLPTDDMTLLTETTPNKSKHIIKTTDYGGITRAASFKAAWWNVPDSLSGLTNDDDEDDDEDDNDDQTSPVRG